jgi:hypothetical protein
MKKVLQLFAFTLALLVIHPIICKGQKGFTLTDESGTIVVTEYDTIPLPTGDQYSRKTREFADSTAAAAYLETIKYQYFATATLYAQLARQDSITARRLQILGSDAGIFILPPVQEKPPEQIPVLITVPEKKKIPATKPKKGKKQ